MKAKKIIILILAVVSVVAFAAFSGCKKGGDNSIDSNADNSQYSEPTGGESSIAPTQKVTVRFLVDGEVYQEVSGTVGSRIVTPKTKPSKDHMTFVKWDGYTNGARFSEDADFNAVFEDIIYKITFVSLGKTVNTVEGKYGDAFQVPANPTAGSGYTFIGWNGLDTSNLIIEDDAEYVAQWEYAAPSIAYATGSFDAATLEKDAIFNNATTVTNFQMVQNTESAADANKAYTVSLVNDGSYLYVYIFSADTDRNDDDRLSFYIVKKGSTETSNVQTYPNKSEPYSTNKDACEAINVGKVEGGYVLKAKIALSTLEISEDNKIGFGVRFIDMNNKVVYLSEGSIVDDSTKTKTGKAINLPKMQLASAATNND